MLHSPFFQKYIRYNLVGLLGTSLYLGVLFFLVHGLHYPAVISSVIAFVLNVLFNFVLSYYWVFRAKVIKTPLLRFTLVSLLGLIINTSIMYVVVHVLQWPYYMGVVIAAFIVPLSNFLLHHFWSFRTK